MSSAIFDFADIRSRMLGGDKPKPQALAEPVCEVCEGGGWEMYGIGIGDPHFRTCPKCHNPEDHPSP